MKESRIARRLKVKKNSLSAVSIRDTDADVPYRNTSSSKNVTPVIFQAKYPSETQLLKTTGIYDQVTESVSPDRRTETKRKKHHQIMLSVPKEVYLATERGELSLIPKPLYESQKSSAHTFQQAKEATLEEVGELSSAL